MNSSFGKESAEDDLLKMLEAAREVAEGLAETERVVRFTPMLFDPDKGLGLILCDPEIANDKARKSELARALSRQLDNDSGCVGYGFIAEAWSVCRKKEDLEHDEEDDYVMPMPSECEDRVEVVIVSVITRHGTGYSLRPVERYDDGSGYRLIGEWDTRTSFEDGNTFEGALVQRGTGTRFSGLN